MDRLLTLPAASYMLATPEHDMLAWVDAGLFPPPTRMPDGRLCWWESTIRDWTRSREVPIVANDGQDDGQSDDESYGPEVQDMATEILRVLDRFPGWITGPKIAAEIDAETDRYGGTFKRAIRMLTKQGLISSGGRKGYRRTAEPVDDRGQ